MTDLQVGIFPHPSNKALMNVFTPHCSDPWLPEASPHSPSTLTAFLQPLLWASGLHLQRAWMLLQILAILWITFLGKELKMDHQKLCFYLHRKISKL